MRPGENGFLVPPRDARSLANRVEELYLDPELRRRMGVRSREIIENEYDDRIVVERILREIGIPLIAPAS